MCIIYFLGGPPAAPVFMFLMNLSLMYSDKKEIKPIAIRKIKIFLSGYLLNFLRGVLPLLTAQLTGIKITEKMTSEQSSFLNIFLIADILQFAGLALLLMTLARKLRLNKLIFSN
ncbi:MAG: DUF1624 domain-containing protein [Actinobacteria bacterium]|nr:DUF1624 domain-containing protein [Actinomycetota bacterium]